MSERKALGEWICDLEERGNLRNISVVKFNGGFECGEFITVGEINSSLKEKKQKKAANRIQDSISSVCKKCPQYYSRQGPCKPSSFVFSSTFTTVGVIHNSENIPERIKKNSTGFMLKRV